nr:thioredoxin domain-containing protein [Polyangiaceae bacterium]
MKQGTALVGFLLSFLSGAGLIYGLEHRAPNATRDVVAGAGFAADDRESPLPVGPGDAVWGSATAPVTATIFSDFQCPFCARLGPTFEKLKQTYGPATLRIVWKQNPLSFHKDARPAALAAQAVLAAKGSEAFWKFHDLAFKNQPGLNEDNYAKWAQEAGVDAATFAKFKADPAVAKKVDDDLELAKKVGANGTPHTFINGTLVAGGAVPYEKFKEQIDQQLDKAKAKLAAGAKPEKLYAALVKENLSPPKPAGGPERKADQARRDEEAKTVWKVALGKAPVTGNDKAPVTIVLFSDYQCPFCKRAEDAIKKVTDALGDKVRVAWKDMPLPNHPRARPSATFALEARAQKGDKAFWEAHDKLFASAPKLEDADFERIAGEMGLDFAKIKDAIAKDKYKAAIEADQSQLEDLGASGTPQLYVNGRHLAGAPAPEALRAMVDEEIKKAEALAARGVAPGKIYDEIMKEGKEPPPPERKQIAAPGKEQPFKGGARAKVVIQEFSDFECPACNRAEPTVKQ